MTAEVIVRILLWATFMFLETCEPFIRKIAPEELWLYKYPHSEEYVPSYMLWVIVLIIPISIIALNHILNRKTTEPDLFSGLSCLTLIVGLNGLITVCLKIFVGRPRPDFYYRCFPDGVGDERLHCTGDKHLIMEGRKSFPSGHSSYCSASMTFVSLFLNDKLQPFGKHRGVSWRLLCVLLPLIFAGIIAISRTCDYRHHWQDVVVGSILGSSIAYLCYNQYYPPIVQNGFTALK